MSWKQQRYEYEETRTVHPWSKYPWRKSYVVWTICGATFLCFLAVSGNPVHFTKLAMTCDETFRIWQLLSASFTEVNLIALLGFLSLQLVFGVPLEHEWSRRDLALTYLLSAVGVNLLLLALAPQGMRFASPIGAVSGLLAAAWYNLGREEWNLFILKKMRLRTIIIAIMVVMNIMSLLNGFFLMIVVSLAGFGIGMLYCWLEKQLQQQEGAKHKVEKKRISNIEID